MPPKLGRPTIYRGELIGMVLAIANNIEFTVIKLKFTDHLKVSADLLT